jgi:hypothetical protein
MKNVGNGFQSRGPLVVRRSFFDFEIPATGNFTDVTRGRVTATRAITDFLMGQCPVKSLSLAPRPNLQRPSPSAQAKFAGFVMFGLGVVFLGTIVYSHFSGPKVMGQSARPAREVVASAFIRSIDEPNDIDVGDP